MKDTNIVNVTRVPTDGDSWCSRLDVDRIKGLHGINESLQGSKNFVAAGFVDAVASLPVAVKRSEKGSTILSTTAVVNSGNQIALVRVPEVREVRLDGSGLLAVPGGSTRIVQSVGKIGALEKCTILNHMGEEVTALDFFPKIETISLPVVGDILEIGFDYGICGVFAVVEFGLNIVGALASVKKHICEFRECDGTESGAIGLWASPLYHHLSISIRHC